MPSLVANGSRTPVLLCGTLKRLDGVGGWHDVHVELRESGVACFSAADKAELLAALTIDADTRCSTAHHGPVAAVTICLGGEPRNGAKTELVLAAEPSVKLARWTETLEACCLKAQLQARRSASLAVATPTSSDRTRNGDEPRALSPFGTPAAADVSPATSLMRDVARLQRGELVGARGSVENFEQLPSPSTKPLPTPLSGCGAGGQVGGNAGGRDARVSAHAAYAWPTPPNRTETTIAPPTRTEIAASGRREMMERELIVEEREREVGERESRLRRLEEVKILLEKERVVVYREREKGVDLRIRAVEEQERAVEAKLMQVLVQERDVAAREEDLRFSVNEAEARERSIQRKAETMLLTERERVRMYQQVRSRSLLPLY
jgi:hypothetical protein